MRVRNVRLIAVLLLAVLVSAVFVQGVPHTHGGDAADGVLTGPPGATGGHTSTDAHAASPPVSLAAHLHEALGVEEAALDVPAWDLTAAIGAWDERLGVQRAPRALDVLTHLDPIHAEAAARLLAALYVVADERDTAYAGIDAADLHRHMESETDPAAAELVADVDTTRLRAATIALARTVDATLGALHARAAPIDRPAVLGAGTTPLVDLAPVLVMDPVGEANLYDKDSVLAIDLGGDDAYDMNAGGAIIHQGMVGDRSTSQYNLLGHQVGGENEDSFVSYTASLLIDTGGDDQYGVVKPPRPGSRDAICTNDLIVRRVVVQGSGSGGIGMLVDTAGDDTYRGKTLAQGNGHLAGVGAFFDLAGNDDYEAIRSAMGSGVLQGAGVFYDGAGNDAYRFAVPQGGHFNVDRFRCDWGERLGLGSAVIQATGHFVDVSGNDAYQIASQGLGHVEAFGHAAFADLGGADDYGGYADRHNDHMRTGAGVFVDREL